MPSLTSKVKSISHILCKSRLQQAQYDSRKVCGGGRGEYSSKQDWQMIHRRYNCDWPQFQKLSPLGSICNYLAWLSRYAHVKHRTEMALPVRRQEPGLLWRETINLESTSRSFSDLSLRRSMPNDGGKRVAVKPSSWLRLRRSAWLPIIEQQSNLAIAIKFISLDR